MYISYMHKTGLHGIQMKLSNRQFKTVIMISDYYYYLRMRNEIKIDLKSRRKKKQTK